MLLGSPPYTDASGDDMKTFANILGGKLSFKGYGVTPSAEATQMITSLLTVRRSVALEPAPCPQPHTHAHTRSRARRAPRRASLPARSR